MNTPRTREYYLSEQEQLKKKWSDPSLSKSFAIAEAFIALFNQNTGNVTIVHNGSDAIYTGKAIYKMFYVKNFIGISYTLPGRTDLHKTNVLVFRLSRKGVSITYNPTKYTKNHLQSVIKYFIGVDQFGDLWSEIDPSEHVTLLIQLISREENEYNAYRNNGATDEETKLKQSKPLNVLLGLCLDILELHIRSKHKESEPTPTANIS